MAKSSFVSFHYQRDHWRVQQILKMGALDQQAELPAQEWEKVKGNGDDAVEEWIDEQMKYKQAVIVLIGRETGDRKFVRYEILRALKIRKPILGIRIHGLKDDSGNTDLPGKNPFARFNNGPNTPSYDTLVPVFNPADYTNKINPVSTDIYAAIKANIATWATSGYKRP